MAVEIPEARYPDVHVRLTGADRNAFMVVGKVNQALTKAGHGDQAGAFMSEVVLASDQSNLLQGYVDVLQVSRRWVVVL